MKKILLALIFGASVSGFAELTFRIQPNSYLFSTNYDIYSENTYLNSVENSFFQLRKVYTLCDASHPIATGTIRFFSLGSFSNSLSEIDIVDHYDQPIGMIQGNIWTTASAKFSFYDAHNIPIATAFVNLQQAGVSIVSAQNNRLCYALMRRSYSKDGDYFWETKVLDEDAVDLRMLEIFSAFITDAFWPKAPPMPKDPPQTSPTWDAIQTAIIINALLSDE